MNARPVRLTLAAMIVFAPVAALAQSYAVVDTNQQTFYDNAGLISEPTAGAAFFGQDAHHTGHAPSYTVSGDGLSIYDNVTGLTWTQSADWSGDGAIDADDKYTYDQIQSQVDALNAAQYGGYNDWRVPTIKQLYSLIDFSGADIDPMASSADTPFIDTSVFGFGYGDISAGERIIDSQWATSTIYVDTVMHGQEAMFGVNFADGRIKGYPTGLGAGGVEKTYYARFVRGNEQYGLNDLSDNGDGTITDSATGLMWSQGDNGVGVDWENALAWVQACNAEDYLGYDDWRLPDAKELQSIIDYSNSPGTTGSAAIDPLFDATEIVNLAGEDDFGYYWTGTTHARADGAGESAVYLAFGRGMGEMFGEVMDVHGAGCQRSDPKTGDPNDYPLAGQGPQGDVQRVFNFVRLVRDADLLSVLPGDANGDNVVDDADYTLWADSYGQSVSAGSGADFNADGVIDDADYTLWADNYGLSANRTPEPASLALLMAGAGTLLGRRRI